MRSDGNVMGGGLNIGQSEWQGKETRGQITNISNANDSFIIIATGWHGQPYF